MSLKASASAGDAAAVGSRSQLSSMAGREALRNQLIKTRIVGDKLEREEATLRSQLAAAEDRNRDYAAIAQGNVNDDAFLQRVVKELQSENADWRYSYLLEQLDARQRTIKELEPEVAAVRRLESQLAAARGQIVSLRA